MLSVVQHNKLLPALLSPTLTHVSTVLFLQQLNTRKIRARLLLEQDLIRQNTKQTRSSESYILCRDPFHNVVRHLHF